MPRSGAGRERGGPAGPDFIPRADAMLTERLLRLAERRAAERPPSPLSRVVRRGKRAVLLVAAVLAMGAGMLAVYALATGLPGPLAGVGMMPWAGLVLAPIGGAALGGAGLWRRRRQRRRPGP